MAIVAILARLPQVVAYVLFFIWELILANARVAWEVLTPRYSMAAGIVRVETACETDTEIMLLANSISMTPGTLSIEVEEDRNVLYVHTLYADPLDDFLEQVWRMERRLLAATRGPSSPARPPEGRVARRTPGDRGEAT
ncbi:cation transporter [Egibacter rhizosphaerae]|uniref:Cation transporter n=1 Tax=Egibacter rhizosphaerae TaxID=1670831 RepID=A0A411YE84_9ACTN|nr:Na+/H+ antiporter subunit E [Egibacter rhizosphaerae]QBI19511.1 cation transporter [Egibacter rhizosphaerae]